MAEASNHRWRPTLKRRVLVTAVTFLLWAIGIEARLVYLQVFQHDELEARAERQQLRTVPAPAKRGDILDRNGRVLAASADKIKDSDKGPIQSAIEKLKLKASGEDAPAIKQALDELMQVSQAMSQHLYSQEGAPGAADGPSPSSPPGDKKKDDVIDAEFEVKN